MQKGDIKMEYKVLPSIYASQQREHEDEYERQKNNQLNTIVAQKEKEYNDKANKLYKRLDIDKGFGSYMTTICTGVGILLFIMAIGMGIFGLVSQTPDGFGWKILGVIGGVICGAIAGAIAGFIGGFVYGGILGIVLCPIAYPMFRGVCNIIMKKAKLQYREIEKEKARAVENIRQPVLAEIAQHRRETEHIITQYTEEFEQEAQKLSVNFANSTLAKEVIEWLAAGFLKTVKAANRASHIEKIVVPFDFHVEKGEIRCNIGRYNFEEHRCEQLPNVLAQTALARAIASQVQLNMIMQYDKDASGTEYKIDITYKYPEQVKSSYYSSQPRDYVSAHLVYTAPNGNYKPIQKW